jgi:hypothetical protein
MFTKEFVYMSSWLRKKCILVTTVLTVLTVVPHLNGSGESATVIKKKNTSQIGSSVPFGKNYVQRNRSKCRHSFWRCTDNCKIRIVRDPTITCFDNLNNVTSKFKSITYFRFNNRCIKPLLRMSESVVSIVFFCS